MKLRLVVDATLAALALLSELRRRRRRLRALPSTDAVVSYNQPARAPACITRHFLHTPHGQLLYRYSDAAGPAAPLLVLLHAESRSSDEFADLIQLCSSRFRCVAPDLLGFGESDKPRHPLRVPDYAQHVALLLDALAASSAFVLGNSFGAFVAAELTAAHPDRVQRVVLANVYDLDDNVRQRIRAIAKRAPPVSPGPRYVADAWNERAAHLQSSQLNFRCMLDRLRQCGFPAYGEHAMAEYWDHLIQQVAKIKCPAMLLWGLDKLTEQEARRLTWQNDRTKIERAMPHGEVVYLEGRVCMMERFAKKVYARVAPFFRNARSMNM